MDTSPSTSLSVSVLQQVLDANSWTQDDLAARAKVHRSTVSMHLSKQRPIRDEHLVAYLQPLDRHDRQALLAAWLRDTLGADVIGDVLDKAANRVTEQVGEWAPKLTDKDHRMLQWLGNQLTTDEELTNVIRSICRRLGYED